MRIIDELMPRMVEDNIRESLADKHGLIETILEAKDYDIDACLVKFNKPEIVLEVKWKKIKNSDIKKAEENLLKIKAKKREVFVQDKKGLYSKVLNFIDVDDL